MEKREHKRQRQNKERIIRLRWATAIIFHVSYLVLRRTFSGAEVLVLPLLSAEP